MECNCDARLGEQHKEGCSWYKDWTPLQRRRASIGKRTSEGYNPDSNEVVEVRGD